MKHGYVGFVVLALVASACQVTQEPAASEATAGSETTVQVVEQPPAAAQSVPLPAPVALTTDQLVAKNDACGQNWMAGKWDALKADCLAAIAGCPGRALTFGVRPKPRDVAPSGAADNVAHDGLLDRPAGLEDVAGFRWCRYCDEGAAIRLQFDNLSRRKCQQCTSNIRAIAGKNIAQSLFSQLGAGLQAMLRDRFQNVLDNCLLTCHRHILGAYNSMRFSASLATCGSV